jgi:hypothetical protein
MSMPDTSPTNTVPIWRMEMDMAAFPLALGGSSGPPFVHL